MRRFRPLLIAVLAIALVLQVTPVLAGTPNTDPPKPGPDEGTGEQDPFAAMPNLSFPVVATDYIETFYQKTWIDLDLDGEYDGNEFTLTLDADGNPVPIAVVEDIKQQYTGNYDGNEGEFYTTYIIGDDGGPVDLDLDGIADTTEPIDMETWLRSMAPWYPQPVDTTTDDPNLIWNTAYVTAANSWQADWVKTDAAVMIDFIDWGNPMENINPVVGQRFPVEIALYQKLTEPMTAYKMACLEYPSTKTELFGTSTLDGSGYTWESYYATVLTNRFFAEVWNPDGSITKLEIEPGIGPSGKMNFASAGGGWIPTMPGWHRVWLHTNDSLISFEGAIVNNDEHYIMSTGFMAEEISPNKLELTGIVGDSTFIDVLVVKPNGGKK
ncbi:MAG: hypothetical protein JW733_05100 [Coriobacteriia bacterium]|nr:hypothetical protein [Coriobacteriia bacterium]MBN2847307.1 hypothetical protein [Coriobacteriia bacterium]